MQEASLKLKSHCKIEKVFSGNSFQSKNVFVDVSGIGNLSENSHSAYESSQISSIGHSAAASNSESTKSSP